MTQSVYVEMEFFGLIASSVILPAGIYVLLLLKKTISRRTVLAFGVLMVALSGLSIYLLQRLAAIARATHSLLDDRVFASEVALALYLIPALFAGIGINIISHVLIHHLLGAERGYDRIK